MKTIAKKKLKKYIEDTIKEYDEQIDLDMKMIQHVDKDLLIRKNELKKLITKFDL